MKEGSSNPKGFQKTIRNLGICLLVGILIYLLTKNTEGISVAVKDDQISLSYSSGDTFNVNFKDILSVTETQVLGLGSYVSGVETKKHKFGVWENTEFGKYNLCIYATVERYIVVKTTDAVFVLNFESADATDSFYRSFMELLQSMRAGTAPL